MQKLIRKCQCQCIASTLSLSQFAFRHLLIFHWIFFTKNEVHGPIHRYKLIHEKSLSNDLTLLDYTFVDLRTMRKLSRGSDESIGVLQQRLCQKSKLYDWLYYLTCLENETISVPKTCSAIEAYKLCSNLSKDEQNEYEINEREQADFKSCVTAESALLIQQIQSLMEENQALKEENQENQALKEENQALKEENQENQALKEQIQALKEEMQRLLSSSTDCTQRNMHGSNSR